MSRNHHNARPGIRVVSACRALAAVFLLLAGLPALAADSGDIVVAAVRGEVRVTMNGAVRGVRAGTVLELPATVHTGRDGHIELRQGATSVKVAPDTMLEFPALEQRGAPVDRIVQPRGNAFYDIGKRPGRKLRVETPYLVGVIKGTQFNVAAADDATTISLFEGRLEVRAADDSSMIDLNAGEIASRKRGDAGISVLKMDATRPVAPAARQQRSHGDASDAREAALGEERGNQHHGAQGRVPVVIADATPGVDVGVHGEGRPALPAVPAVQADNPVPPGLDGPDVAAVDAGASVSVNAGPAGVEVDTGTNVDVNANGVTAEIDTGTRADAGSASVAVDNSVSVDAGPGAVSVDVATDTRVEAGPVEVAVDTATSVDVDTATGVTGVGAPVAVDTSVDVSTGNVDLGVGVAGADVGLGLDLGLGDSDPVTDTDSSTTTPTDTGSTDATDVGGLLDGLVRRPGRR